MTRAQENLISNQADVWLDAVRQTVQHHELRGERDQIAPLLQKLIADGAQGCTVDLIGHATNLDPKLPRTPHGACSFLQLADWVIDDSDETFAFFAGIAPLLAKLQANALRLIGCSTAMTPRGWKALARIAQAVAPTPVYGTKRAVFGDDFDADGFGMHPAALACAVVGTDPPPTTRVSGALPVPNMKKPLLKPDLIAERATWIGAPPVPWARAIADAATTDAFWQLVVAGAAHAMPRLLAQPIVELLLPTFDGSAYAHRAQVLLNWELVRVYSRGVADTEELIYEVTDAQKLHALLGDRPAAAAIVTAA